MLNPLVFPGATTLLLCSYTNELDMEKVKIKDHNFLLTSEFIIFICTKKSAIYVLTVFKFVIALYEETVPRTCS